MSYTPASGTLAATWVGAPTYTPGTGALFATWGSPGIAVLGIPAGDVGSHTFELEYLLIEPVGIASGLTFGSATTISHEGEYVPPQAFLHATWAGQDAYTPGSGSVQATWYIEEGVRPVGINSLEFGTTLVQHQAEYILPGGIAPPPDSGPAGDRQVPPPVVEYRTQFVEPDGIAAGSFPTHYIAHYIQYIDLAGRGVVAPTTGSPSQVAYASREIEPPFLFETAFGTHVIYFPVAIEPSGIATSTQFGDFDADINLQRIIVTSDGDETSEVGIPDIRNEREFVYPEWWVSDEINFPVVYNSIQEVYVSPFMDTNDPTEVFGNVAIENIDREMVTSGHQSSRFGLSTWIYNNARPILPDGLDATIWGEDTFIAYRIRDLPVPGIEPYPVSDYVVVFNDARIVAPSGFASSSFGTPSQVLNLNQAVRHVSPYEGPLTGTAFVAYGVRTVVQAYMPEGVGGIPEVRFNPHPIAPAGITPPQFGAADVEEHFTVAAPKSFNVFSPERVGEPYVANRNREYILTLQEQSEYGFATIYNYIQYKEIGGLDLSVVPAPFIGRRTRYVAQQSMSVPQFPITHQIRNLIPDPPAQQTVQVPSTYIGFIERPGVFGAVVVDNRTIFPVGSLFEDFGNTSVRGNTLYPVSILPLYALGIPLLNPTQYIDLDAQGFNTSDEMSELDVAPRFSPHTIYAPEGTEATLQAKANHPSGPPEPISEGARFGTPIATNQHRTIYPTWGLLPSHEFGNQQIDLKTRRLYPNGIRSLRFGQIVFLNVPQFITLDEFAPGIYDEQHGAHTVAFPLVAVDPFADPVGWESSEFGDHNVENQHRTVYPSTINHRGNPESDPPYDTNPWGTALVGYPREYELSVGDQTLWGTARVEYWIRDLPVEGFDALRMSPEWLQFADRMRISQRNLPNSLPGIFTEEVGTPWISNSTRYLEALGSEFDAFGAAGVREIQRVLPSGFSTTTFGDIDEWVYGELKTAGYDMSVVSFPNLSRTAPMDGSDVAEYGTPTMAFGVTVYGMPEVGFAGPAVVRVTDCGNRVIAVSAGPGGEDIGDLEVSHA